MRLISLVLLFSCNLALAKFPTAADHYINGCRIYASDQAEIKNLPGDRCLFFDNGDFISSNSEWVRYYSKDLAVKWEVKGSFHHQMNFSPDKQRILTMTSISAVMPGIESRRYDQLVVIDLNGKILKTLDFNKVLEQTKIKPMYFPNPFKAQVNVEREGSHVNSFYEIPAQKDSAKLPDYIRPGNYIVNGVKQGFFVLDQELTKSLKTWMSTSARNHNVHDVQVTPEGRMIYFNNRVLLPDPELFASSVVEEDLATGEKTLEITSNPVGLFYSRHSGGVQIIDEDLVMFSHAVAGFYVYSRKAKQITFTGIGPYLNDETYRPVQQINTQQLGKFLEAHKKKN